MSANYSGCLLYTSDAADERSSVDLGGRRIIKKKKKIKLCVGRMLHKKGKITNHITNIGNKAHKEDIKR